ncbi:helix-turn-helix domain-containing protein [Kribbella endophytica]
MDLGAELRDRRKTAGRTIASVAVDAGLSVPYIANLENGRGNPTVATLTRLAEALGTTLRVELEDPPTDLPRSSSGRSGLGPSDLSGRIADNLSPRALQVTKQLAEAQGRSPRAVRQDLLTTLEALAGLLGKEPTPADLDRLLDLALLAGN